jgi:rhamnosyltransferase
MNNDILLSIVIPVLNGIKTLPKLIQGLEDQILFDQIEVIAVDSGSTDGSVTYLEQFDFVRVIQIAPKEFNHGATRNLAIQHCKGEFIFMTVQDAWTTDPKLLENMLAHFKDNEVMGVCGQQIVPQIKGYNPHQWFRPQSEASQRTLQFKRIEDFHSLTPKEQRQACGWDDVIAMYRKTALQVLPFEPLIFGEDMMWAKMALQKGWAIVYDTSCRVNHYHFEFPNFTYKRTLIARFFIYKCFNYFDNRTYSLKDKIRMVLRNLKWGVHPKWIPHNLKIMRNVNEATQHLKRHIDNNTLKELEKELALSVPVGKQVKSKSNERQ